MARGTVRSRSKGSWDLRWDEPRGEDGKRNQKSRVFRGTKKGAQAELIRIEAELNKSEAELNKSEAELKKSDAERGSELPVAECCKLFLKERTGKDLRSGTSRGYQMFFRKYLFPECGDMPVAKVERSHLQRVVNTMVDCGLKANTVRRYSVFMKGLFSWAVAQKFLGGSPVNGKVLSLPEKCRESSGQMLSGPEAVEHLSAFEGSPYGLPVLLGLYTGMRPGEVLGLSWDDVDLVRGTVSVRHSLDVRYGFNLGPPKTPTSVRKIRVPPVVVEALREAGERKPANFWLSQKTKGEDGKLKPVSVPVEFRQVCAFPDGRIMTAKNWGKAFRSTLCAAGLRQIRPHDLRHTHASLLLLGGVPMYVVSRRLGHASVAFTVDLYGHLLPETDSDVASRLEEILEIVNGGDKVGRVGGGLLSIGDLAGIQVARDECRQGWTSGPWL